MTENQYTVRCRRRHKIDGNRAESEAESDSEEADVEGWYTFWVSRPSDGEKLGHHISYCRLPLKDSTFISQLVVLIVPHNRFESEKENE